MTFSDTMSNVSEDSMQSRLYRTAKEMLDGQNMRVTGRSSQMSQTSWASASLMSREFIDEFVRSEQQLDVFRTEEMREQFQDIQAFARKLQEKYQLLRAQYQVIQTEIADQEAHAANFDPNYLEMGVVKLRIDEKVAKSATNTVYIQQELAKVKEAKTAELKELESVKKHLEELKFQAAAHVAEMENEIVCYNGKTDRKINELIQENNDLQIEIAKTREGLRIRRELQAQRLAEKQQQSRERQATLKVAGCI